MKMEDQYSSFIAEIKDAILQSRYTAAKLVNREMLLLYFKLGNMLSEKIAAEKWGAKVTEKISQDIQREFSGIKGFSVKNLKNMRQFYEEYHFLAIGQAVPAQIGDKIPRNRKKQTSIDVVYFKECFLQVGFTHHLLLLQRCKNLEERLFYLRKIIENQWSSRVLEYHLDSKLYQSQGKIQTNFSQTLPEKLQKHALQVFKDEYLLNHINVTDEEDELAIDAPCKNIQI